MLYCYFVINIITVLLFLRITSLLFLSFSQTQTSFFFLVKHYLLGLIFFFLEGCYWCAAQNTVFNDSGVPFTGL